FVEALEHKLAILRKVVPIADLLLEMQDFALQVRARGLQRIGLFESKERFIMTAHQLQHCAAAPPGVGGRLNPQREVIACERLGKLALVLKGRRFVRVSKDVSRIERDRAIVTVNSLAEALQSLQRNAPIDMGIGLRAVDRQGSVETVQRLLRPIEGEQGYP